MYSGTGCIACKGTLHAFATWFYFTASGTDIQLSMATVRSYFVKTWVFFMKNNEFRCYIEVYWYSRWYHKIGQIFG